MEVTKWLKPRASASRSSGTWKDEDCDVLAQGQGGGRPSL
jgi:hypothetical protein